MIKAIRAQTPTIVVYAALSVYGAYTLLTSEIRWSEADVAIYGTMFVLALYFGYTLDYLQKQINALRRKD